MRTIEDLLADVEQEARRVDLPVDRPVYERSKRDPLVPIMAAGSLSAPVCSVGRDLGKDEVAAAEPQIGAAGRLVRIGVHRAAGLGEPSWTDRRLDSVLDHVLLTNLVPYKPTGNKAYPESIRARFRPFLAELLVTHWTGNFVLTLGTEAFRWFTPYLEPGQAAEFWKREDRYEAELSCRVSAVVEGVATSRELILGPLPHPSPLNQRWYAKFPDLLARRLSRVWH